MPSLLLAPVALALGLAVGDPSAQPPATPDSAAAVTEAAAPTVIQFENQGWEMATIYVVPQSGMAIRLGQVTSGRVARLVVPRSVPTASTVQIVAVPFASRRAVSSGPVSLHEGEAIRASLASSGNLIAVLPAP